MVALEGVEHLLPAAVDEGALEVPFRVRHAGDVVVLVALAGGVVDHHVPVLGPPLDAVFELQVVLGQLVATDQRTVRDPAAVQRFFGTQQLFTNARVDAVGTDHDVGVGYLAVGESQAHLGIGFFKGFPGAC